MEADVIIDYTNANNHLEEVAIRVNSAQPTGQAASILTMDTALCAAGTIGACLTATTKPGLVYAAKDTPSGGEPFYNPGFRNNYFVWLHGGCGRLVARWRLQEASAAKYNFWSDVFGTIRPDDLVGDPRFNGTYTTVRVSVT